MLKLENDKTKIQPKHNIWDAYIWVYNAQQLFERYRKNGAIVLREPAIIKQYNNLEFILQYPDGYNLAFGQDLIEQSSR